MLKLLKRFQKRDWICAVLAIGFIVVQIWMELTLPDYMIEITQLISSGNTSAAEILVPGGKMLLCALGSMFASVATSVLSASLASNFSFNLRSALFRKVQDFSLTEINRFSTASLITRTTNDIQQVQMLFTMGLQMLIKAPITGVWAFTKIYGKNGTWTLATGLAVVVLLGGVGLTMSLVVPKFGKMQTLTDSLNRITRENLNGIEVIRAYNAEDHQVDKFEEVNKELTETSLFTGHVMAFMSPMMTLVNSGLTLAIYWIGAILINNAGMTEKIGIFSDMVVFTSYAMQVVMSFMMLIGIFIMVPRAKVSGERISEVLDTEPSIADGTRDAALEEDAGLVEFKNVSFKYADAEDYILHDISFSCRRGDTLAIIGPTGCGKSTLINLIPRFYDCTEGEVLVDGVNVKEYQQEELHNKIGYVSQKSVLFQGTIRSNIQYGSTYDPHTDEKMNSAIEIAQAAEFVEKMEKGAESYVAQDGGNYSGGQKQRLSIARAIARDPEILIFDDSFSALDYRTDKTLRDALKEHCSDATKIIVAQRIGTIRDANRILVMEEGKIVGDGTHSELMKNCEVYQEIAYSQLSKEELA
ncbi:MAG: ABC transporter ATP-binding protein [Oscillospiraceae bacterium]|nr:ABC transporter ATP-binding protein [Oscillospiraceae bacterium]